ncbi:MAG: histidine triad nucleotide-binding protein [Clostridiales bacterium]|nr:histidine triad nucleotide-binding protein [Clostridiales bacterium]
MESSCIFCKIAAGEIPAQKVYEDDTVLAFEDIHPCAPVHVLVIPKQHVASVMELNVQNEQMLPALFAAIRRVAEIKGIAQSGFRVVSNVGKDGGQSVEHLHFHVLGGRSFGESFG